MGNAEMGNAEMGNAEMGNAEKGDAEKGVKSHYIRMAYDPFVCSITLEWLMTPLFAPPLFAPPLFAPTDVLPIVLDILRNETLITAGLSLDDPTANFISAGTEKTKSRYTALIRKPSE